MALPPGPVGLKFWQPRVETTDSWRLLFSLGGTDATGPGLGGYTIRQLIAATAFDASLPATGTQVRITIKGASSGGASWDKMYVGHAAPSGDNIDFDGTQVQLLFGGSASGSVGTGATLVSDPVNYAFDKTKNLIVSVHFTSFTDLWANTSATGFTARFRDTIDEAATTDVVAGFYSTSPSASFGFAAVEVYSGIVADSGPVTLPAAGGSYTLTGAATGLGPGYQLTGFDVTFATASSGTTTLTAAAGSYTLTGTAAALSYSATFTAGAGSYALTGTAAGLGLGYWLTGSDVTFTTAAGSGTTLTAAAGSYTLTGSAAALALRHTAGAGSYSLTGTAAAYRFTLAAAANSYTLTGSPAGFLAPFRLPAAVGAYTLTGSDAALTVISGIVLFCGSGSYTLTGFDAALPQPGGPVEPPTAGGVGSVSRGRMIRRRRKREDEEQEEPIPVIGSTPVAEVPPGPSLPPQPGLMAHMPPVQPAKIPKRADPDEEEDEIALLLELIS